ncbi:MAG: LPS export ABC transporter periplasmic protein LptC [Spirochaetota bacterium]
MIKIILYFLVYFTVFFQSICHASGAKEPEKVVLPSQTTDVPDYILHDVIHYQYDSGVLKVKVIFENGSFSRGKEELHVENCGFEYYDSNEVVISRGSAKEATIFMGRSELFADGDVVVVSELNGAKLETDHLEWHGKNNQFTTESFVTITRITGDIIQGYGMISDVGLRYIKIKKNVRGIIRSD